MLDKIVEVLNKILNKKKKSNDDKNLDNLFEKLFEKINKLDEKIEKIEQNNNYIAVKLEKTTKNIENKMDEIEILSEKINNISKKTDSNEWKIEKAIKEKNEKSILYNDEISTDSRKDKKTDINFWKLKDIGNLFLKGRRLTLIFIKNDVGVKNQLIFNVVSNIYIINVIVNSILFKYNYFKFNSLLENFIGGNKLKSISLDEIYNYIENTPHSISCEKLNNTEFKCHITAIINKNNEEEIYKSYKSSHQNTKNIDKLKELIYERINMIDEEYDINTESVYGIKTDIYLPIK